MRRALIGFALSLLFVVGVVSASAVNNAATATVVTEFHTYSDVVTVSAKGKQQLFTVQGTITDLDTIPDPVTVTVTGPTLGLPVAAFTMTPADPVVGQPVVFDGASSACPDGPCVYEWVDDGPDGPAGTQWPLCGNIVQCVFTFGRPGTIWARLNLTDRSGDRSTVMREFTLLTTPTPTTTTTPTVPPPAGGETANLWVAP